MSVHPFVNEAVTQKLHSDTVHNDANYFDQDSVLVLRARRGNHAFQLSFQQLQSGVVIGRSSFATLDPLFVNMEPLGGVESGVSRQHARLFYKPMVQSIVVVDLKSANGTFLNGERLRIIEVRALGHGDKLRFGSLEFSVTILQA